MRVSASIVLAMLLFFNSESLNATAQIPDELVFQGKSFALQTNPLSRHPQFKKIKFPKDAVISSANWRGHVAIWKIENGALLLSGINIFVNKGKHNHQSQSAASSFFKPLPIIADWYSGALIVPYGELVNYQHLGYGSEFSDYHVFNIQNGKVISHLQLNSKQFVEYKDRKYEAFRKTKTFKEAYSSALKSFGKDDAELADSFVRSQYAEIYLAM